MAQGYPAARLLDPICHSFEEVGMMAGLGLGIAIGVIELLAGSVTGPGEVVVAAIAVGGAAALAASGQMLARGIQTMFGFSDPLCGVLMTGSSNVYVNGRKACRAANDVATSCIGLTTHPTIFLPIPVAEGAQTVFINHRPMATVASHLVCGAVVKSGSSDVIVGGPLAQVLPVINLAQLLEPVINEINFAFMCLMGPFPGSMISVMETLDHARQWLNSKWAGSGDTLFGGVGVALGTIPLWGPKVFPKTTRGAKVLDSTSSTTPVGRRSGASPGEPKIVYDFPNPNYPKPRNQPATIGNRQYSGHAIDRMQERGLTPTVIDHTITFGQASAGKVPGTTKYFDPINNVTVVIVNASGRVRTVW